MTIIELFPYLVSIGIAVISGLVLKKNTNLDDILVATIAIISGFVSWILYVLLFKYAAETSDRKKKKNATFEKKKRKYHPLDLTKDFQVGRNIFYECTHCGMSISSVPKKDSSCICRNITIKANSQGIKVHEIEKVKLYSD